MKALLISTLISVSSSNYRPPVVDQMHIWFEGPAAGAECNRTEEVIHFGRFTDYGNDKVSVNYENDRHSTVTRKTQCITF